MLFAQNFRQLAQATTFPQIDLPRAVTSSVKALNEEHIVMIVGIDVQHAVFIDNDFSGRTEALDWVFGGVASRAG